MEYITSFPGYFVDFVQSLGTVQLIAGGVVALFFGIAAATIGSAIFLPVVATIVYLAVEAVLPALASRASVAVPVFDAALLQRAVALYIVFLVAMGVVFGVKKAILGLSGK
jgi:hypothetical protein